MSIEIKVKCFAHVKNAVGKDIISLKMKENSTSDDVEKMIRKMTNSKLNNIAFKIAVNQKYVSSNVLLNDGDEVVLISPVQGG
tara:strand:+ start:47974 stop:48222 length:249 start_codon:yes stop_codon:yes gene_type:complete